MKKISISKRQSIYGFCFALPTLIGFIIFVLIPLVLTIYYSFTNGSGNFVGIENYVNLLNSYAFLLAMKNTGMYLIFGGFTTILLSFIIAWALYKLAINHRSYSSKIEILYLLPLIIPTCVSVIIVEIIFDINGVINNIFNSSINWLDTSEYSFCILVFIYIWKNFGYFTIIFLAAFSQIPTGILEAAKLDGAHEINIMRKIILPLINPSMFFVFIMSTIAVFKMNRESYLLYGNYPQESAYMLQNFIDNNISSLEINRAATSAMYLFLFFAVFIYFLIKNSEKTD